MLHGTDAQYSLLPHYDTSLSSESPLDNTKELKQDPSNGHGGARGPSYNLLVVAAVALNFTMMIATCIMMFRLCRQFGKQAEAVARPDQYIGLPNHI